MNAFSKFLNVLLAVLLVAAPAMAAEQLIGEWLLDEAASGGVFPDTSGFGYDADVYGVEYDSGQGAFYFDGDKEDADGPDYLDIVDAVYPYDFSEDFRITLDVKTTAAGWRPFFSRRAGDGWSAGDWFMAVHEGVIEGNGHSVGGYGPGTKIVNDGMWHTIELTYDASTDTITCNVDNSTTDDFSTSPFKGSTPDNSGHIWIGNHSNYQFFEGWIKNVRVYRVAKTAYNPYPEFGSYGAPTGEQTLNWLSPDGAVTWYDVYVGTDEALVDARDASVKQASHITANSFDYTLTGDTHYYWAVDCFYDPNTVNEIDEYALWEGLRGDTWDFTTQGNYAVNFAPVDESTEMSVFTDLSWNVDFEADSYNIYMANTLAGLDSASPVSYTQTGTEITFEPGTLQIHRTYFWKVGVVRGGEEYLSSARWFRTAGIDYLDDFNSYASNAEVRAVWQCPVYQTNELEVGPNYSRYGLVVPFKTTDVTYYREFDEALDFTGLPAAVFEFYYKSSTEGAQPDSFSLKFQDASGGVIVEKTVDSNDDFVTPEGGSIEGAWHWVYLSLEGAPNIDAVKKVTLTIPGQAAEGQFHIDNLALRIPYCNSDIPGDLYDDCQIDLRDFDLMAQNWLECNRIPAETCFDYWYQADVE